MIRSIVAGFLVVGIAVLAGCGGSEVASQGNPPTATLATQVVTPQADSVTVIRTVADTYLRSDRPNTNFGTRPDLLVGYFLDPPGSYRTLIRFGLPTPPLGAALTNARLFVHQRAGGPDPCVVTLHRATRIWAEPNATWNTNAAFFDPTVLGARTMSTATAPRWFSYVVTSTAQFWLNNPTKNHGLLLRGTETGFSLVTIASRSEGALAPWMRLEYDLP